MKPHYTNKEISWLSFNARVLQEAEDPSVPLIERIKFLGIFSSNLDEFFRVRVATLRRLASLGQRARSIIGEDPKKVLKEINAAVLKQNARVDGVYRKMTGELEKEKIFILDEHKLTPEQAAFVKDNFNEQVRPRLVPIMLDQAPEFPVLKDRSLYLAVALGKRSDPKWRRFSLIEVPTDSLSRFLRLPKAGDKEKIQLIFLDDVIRSGLREVFSFFEADAFEAYAVKVTRDAELDIESDLSESYVKQIARSLKRRKQGNPVRLIYDEKMPQDLLGLFVRRLSLTKDDALIPGARYHNFRDLMKFPGVGPAALRYRPLKALSHPALEGRRSIFSAVSERDVLLHFPYHSFSHVIDLLREASLDPQVVSIKISLYRLAKKSQVVNALVNAVRNGKSVIVVLELTARFDEEANLSWANQMKEEGVKVIYGAPGLKVHAKLILVTRREGNKRKQWAALGTGNFNEETSKVYSDHAMLTADPRITEEVEKVFALFENFYHVSPFRHLLVSPFTMRRKISQLILNEIRNAKHGKPASIFVKVNNLSDVGMVARLAEASQAGVQVRLIVRGMFSLVPGIPGITEKIEAISIVDRFLEHSRVFVFLNGGEERVYLSSGDWMERNFDRRVEVAWPIYDAGLRAEIKTFMDLQWKDSAKARVLNATLNNTYRPGAEPKVRAQAAIYDFLKNQSAPIQKGAAA